MVWNSPNLTPDIAKLFRRVTMDDVKSPPSMPSLTIFFRHPSDRDFVDCVAIAQAAWPDFKERPSIYHLFTKHFSNTCFVSEIEGRICGFVLGFLSQAHPGVAYLHLVAVHPDFQSRGIASELYEHFIQNARALHCARIELIVNPDNPRSIAFHQKLGFQEDTPADPVIIDGVVATRDYNGLGIHMVRFHKDI
jgi:ribosomal protein S18 acetylase RimI-like enzyme